MAWRSIDALSRRIYWTVLSLSYFSVVLSGQTGVSLRVANGSGLMVAPSLQLPASPIGAAVADLNGDGKPDMVVTGQGTGNVTVLLGNGKGGFAASAAYPAGKQPASVIVADINGDGRTDIVVTDRTAGTIAVLSGNGDGTFGSASTFAAIANPVGLTAANLSGKGRSDLVVANATGVAVLLNDGAGHFGSPTNFMLTSQPVSVTAADLRGQGHDDVVVAGQNGALIVMLGNGAGQLRATSPMAVAAGALSAVAAGDFNRDGKLDLALTVSNTNEAAILMGRGDGSFQAAGMYAVGATPNSILSVDLRGTGVQDLVTLNRGANTFSVLLGNGDGSFRTPIDFVAGNGPVAALAGNFSSSGHIDVVTLNSQSNDVTFNAGNGDGTFVAARSYRAGGLDHKSVATGDLNGDGRSDVVVANLCGVDAACLGSGNASVYLADANGGYVFSGSYALGSGPVAIALADLKGDHTLALVALNRNEKTMMMMPGNGDGTFGQAQTYSLSSAPRALLVGDLNGDSKADVAITADCGQSVCTQAGSLHIFAGRGDGSLVESANYPTGFSPVSIATGDLRGTGHADIVVANACGEDASCKAPGTALIFANDGAGRLTRGTEINIGSAPSSIALGSLSGNGLDLVVAQSAAGKVAVLHGDGNGGFASPVLYSAGVAPSSVTLADIRGTGHLDVAVSNLQSSTLSLLYGKGDGTLQAAVTVPVGTGPEAVVATSALKGAGANLVTGNGNSGSTPAGADFTVIVRPMATAAPGAATLTVTPAGALTVDQSVTLGVTVAASGGLGTPTGNVQFQYSTDGGGTFNSLTDCGGATGRPLDGTGAASCVTQMIPAGANIVLQGNYLGDGTIYSGTTSNQVTRTVNAAATTVTLDAIADYTVGATVALRATVVPTSGAPISVPFAGSINFRDGANPIAGCTPAFDAATGVATCSTPDLPAGARNITAIYNNTGDANYQTGTSAARTPTGAQAATTTAVPAIANAVVGDTVTLSATLALQSGNPIPPLLGMTGTVTFRTSGNPAALCTANTISAAGIASCTTTALKVNTYAITATYSGDGNYGGSSNATATIFNVTQVATTAHMGAVANFTVDDNVTLTSTITLNTGSGIPAGVPVTGTVTFLDGNAAIGGGCANPANITATGAASCSTTTLFHGAHSITATYNGDTNYGASSASTATTPSGALVGTTEAVTGPATFSVNNPVTLTATITLAGGRAISVPIGGNVTFTDTVGPITGCTTAQPVNAAGVATCTATALAAGAHSITATYNGDANYSPSPASPAFPTTGSTTLPTVTVTPSAANQVVNTALTFTAAIAPPAGSSIAISGGNVTFTYSGGTLCNAVPVNTTNDTAACQYANLPAGTYTITATYSGDTNYKGAIGNLNQIVTPGTSTVAINSSQAPSTVNQSVTFNVTVTRNTPPTPAVVPLSGNVTVTDSANGQALSCSAFNTSTGTLSCTTQSLTLGSHTLTANYTGDPSYPGQGTLGQTVNKGTVQLGLVGSSPVTYQSSTTFTASVTAPAGPTGLSGTVEFQDTPTGGVATDIPGCSAVGVKTGAATCTTSSLILGGHVITAIYNGDSNFNTPAAPVTFPITVNQAAGNTLTLASSSNPAVVNQANTVTFNATFTVSSGSVVGITGNIAFTDNGNPIPNCSAQPLSVQPPLAGNTVSTTAIAQCADPSLDAKHSPHVIAASYGGDHNFAAASGTFAGNETVSAAATSLTLTTSGTPSTVNASVTFTAKVGFPFPAGGVPLSGTVRFQDTPAGGAAFDIPGCSSAPVSAVDGTAVCTTTTLALGDHSISAFYTDTAINNLTNFQSVNTQTAQAVNTASVTMSLTAPNGVTATVNQSVPLEFDANLTAPTGATNLTGTVTFTDNSLAMNRTLADGTLSPICVGLPPSSTGSNANGTTTYIVKCSAMGLTAGTHTIAATFSKDANFADTNARPIQGVTVTAANGSLTLISSSPPSPSGIPTSQLNAPVTFTATLTTATGGVSPYITNGVQSGKVNFVDSVTNASIPGCDASPASFSTSQATCTYSNLGEGTHSITATYTDSNGNFTRQSAAPLTQSVSGNATAVTIESFDNTVSQQGPSSVNDSVTFTATVGLQVPPPVQGVLPTWNGQMAFQVNGQKLICSESGSDVIVVHSLTTQKASAKCTTNLLRAPRPAITATYQGDPNFASSFGSFQQVVLPAPVSIDMRSSAVAVQGSNYNYQPIPAFQPGVTNPTAVTFTAFILDKNGNIYSSASGESVDLDTTNGFVRFSDNRVGLPICDGVHITGSLNTGYMATCTCNTGGMCSTPNQGALPDGVNTISAQYFADANTQGGTTDQTRQVNQPVNDFAISNSSAPPVFVSQGYSTKSDPFTPQNLTVTPTSVYLYSTDKLTLTCDVTANTPSNAANPPTCSLLDPKTNAATSAVAVAQPPEPDGAVAQAFVQLVVDATGTATNPVTAGQYTITVTAVDANKLTKTTTFDFGVRPVLSQHLQLASGTNGTTNATFVLPAQEQISNFQCLFMAGTGLSGQKAVGAFNTSCKVGRDTVLGDSGSTGPQTLTLPVEISTGSSTASVVTDRHTTLLVAGVIGLPLFGLLGLIRGRRSLKSVFLAVIALLALSGSVLQMSGCGGSFTTQGTTITNGTTPPGTYFFRVQGTGISGQHIQYESVIVVEVHL